jgi:hypothetical protein
MAKLSELWRGSSMAKTSETWKGSSIAKPTEEKRPETAKVNCWEFKKCGRQPGGHKEKELGTCPATVATDFNGAHGGSAAGRACWAVAGSLCGGKIQGTYAQKLNNCWRCEFMNLVKREEEPTLFGFSHTRLGIESVLKKSKIG